MSKLIMIEVGTTINKDVEGMVVLKVNGETATMDIEQARKVLFSLAGSIESAAADMLLFRYLLGQGCTEDEALAAMLDFREKKREVSTSPTTH
jgi:hypothetical protein